MSHLSTAVADNGCWPAHVEPGDQRPPPLGRPRPPPGEAGVSEQVPAQRLGLEDCSKL